MNSVKIETLRADVHDLYNNSSSFGNTGISGNTGPTGKVNYSESNPFRKGAVGPSDPSLSSTMNYMNFDDTPEEFSSPASFNLSEPLGPRFYPGAVDGTFPGTSLSFSEPPFCSTKISYSDSSVLFSTVGDTLIDLTQPKISLLFRQVLINLRF